MLTLLSSLAFAAAPSPVDVSVGTLAADPLNSGTLAVVAHPTRLVAVEARGETGEPAGFVVTSTATSLRYASTASLSARLSWIPGPDPDEPRMGNAEAWVSLGGAYGSVRSAMVSSTVLSYDDVRRPSPAFGGAIGAGAILWGGPVGLQLDVRHEELFGHQEDGDPNTPASFRIAPTSVGLSLVVAPAGRRHGLEPRDTEG